MCCASVDILLPKRTTKYATQTETTISINLARKVTRSLPSCASVNTSLRPGSVLLNLLLCTIMNRRRKLKLGPRMVEDALLIVVQHIP